MAKETPGESSTTANDGVATGAATANDGPATAAASNTATQETVQSPTEKQPAAEKTYTQADLQREIDKQKRIFEKAAADAAAKAKLSEDERKDAELQDLRSQLQMRDAKDQVTAALEKAGVRSADLMWKAIRGDLVFGPDGKLTNLDGLLKDLTADYPDEFGVRKPSESIDASDKGKGGETLTREKLAKMTPAEINTLDWNDVRKVMSAA
jgi:hypothetical protein